MPWANVCGDGHINPLEEECDDGNNRNTDACDFLEDRRLHGSTEDAPGVEVQATSQLYRGAGPQPAAELSKQGSAHPGGWELFGDFDTPCQVREVWIRRKRGILDDDGVVGRFEEPVLVSQRKAEFTVCLRIDHLIGNTYG